MAEPKTEPVRDGSTYRAARRDGTMSKLEELVTTKGQREEGSFVYTLTEGKTTVTYDPRIRSMVVVVNGETVMSTRSREPQFVDRGPWLERLLGKPSEPEAAAETKGA